MDSTHNMSDEELWVEWIGAATPITDAEYAEIPLASHSMVPKEILGEAKIDTDKRLVACKLPGRCLHRSPSYSGPL